MYQLSSSIYGHEQDVRSVVALSNGSFASASRDGKAFLWKKQDRDWIKSLIYATDKFINSAAFDETKQVLYLGGQDMLINGFSVDDSTTLEPDYVLVGHKSNVCSLSCWQNYVLSSSWDKTGKVWENGKVKYDLVGHAASVWDIKAVNEDTFLTASADRTIKVWKGSKSVKTFSGIHNDVIRHVAVYGEGDKFASCSNDGTIKIMDLDGNVQKTLIGHESFVYAVKYLEDGRLVSCGEDRTVRVWSTDGEVQQVITLPAISIWDLDLFPNGDIVVGCSDKSIRIFSQETSRLASEQDLQAFQQEVESSAHSAQSMEFNESRLSPPEVLKKPGNEGQIVVVKSEAGILEAHRYTQEAWSKVGDVVSSAGSDKKAEYNGKRYDYVFDVDISDNMPPLKLPFNLTDNPYVTADKFLADNELPSSYKEEVVRFIIKNTDAVTFEPESAPPTQSAPVASFVGKVVPTKTYLRLSAYNVDAIFSGIVKLNASEKTFNDEELASTGAALHDLEENYEFLFTQAEVIRSSWKTKTPSYDILRLIVHLLPTADCMSDFIEEGLGSSDPTLAMLTIRALANCFSNPTWGEELMSKESVYSSVFKTIDDQSFANPKLQTATAVAIATLLLNYSVYIVQHNQLDLVPEISDTLNTKFGPSAFCQHCEEAAYRMAVAYGNLSTVEPVLRQFTQSISWLKKIRTTYQGIPRFQDILSDLFA